MTISLEIVIVLMLLALAFAFLNGYQDAANSIATVVSTGALKPKHAVIFAALFNVLALFVFQTSVANTVGRGTIESHVVDQHVLLGALVGAIAWNVITRAFGIPVSSSHALIGGLVGAAIAKAGTDALIASGVLQTLLFVVLSPAIGFFLGSLLMLAVAWIFFRTPQLKVDRWFRRIQLGSAALYSMAHAGNDAQKTMGVMWMILLAAGVTTSSAVAPPQWVTWLAYGAIGFGTLLGGWRVVRAMEQKMTKMKPVGGACAETGGAIALLMATAAGIPVSTTHTITGAVIGVGSSSRISAARWGVANRMVVAWLLTLPCSGLIAAIAWWLSSTFAKSMKELF